MSNKNVVGLNIRAQATSRSECLGLLVRDSVIEVGQHSPDRKWARITRVVDGGIDSVRSDGAIPPEAANGWVFLGELDPDPSPEVFDEVRVLPIPHAVKGGSVLGYLGEDVPARAGPIAGRPVSRKLLHLEVFSGDDVPGYLAASRSWAKQHLPDNERTLLLLRPGDTLLDEPNGKVAHTLLWAQVLPLAGLEVKEVDGKRWRKVARLTSSNGTEAVGWVEEANHLASPWEWPGFEVVDEPNSASGASWIDLAAKVAFIKREGPRPEKTPLYQALRKLVDTSGDGSLSEEELDAALRNRSKAAHVGRLIVRHDSEWAQEPASRQQQVARSIADALGFGVVKQVEDEMPRAARLPWWDEVADGAEGFPTSPRVYHFHPGALGMNFLALRASKLNDLIQRIGDIISHGEGGYESYNTGTKGVAGGRVGHGFISPPPGTVTSKTINEILATEPLSGTDRGRMFATGKYQTVFATLKEAKRTMRLTGDELYDADMQERTFREFLLHKAGGGRLARFVINGEGAVDDAQHAAAKEWASIATPAGRTIFNGEVSNGSMSYYAGSANSANRKSTSDLRSILEEIRQGRNN